MTRGRAAAVALGALLSGASPVHAGGGDRSACVVDGRYVMGTILQVEICVPDARARQVALDAAFANALHLDAVLTTFTDSPTVQLNAHAGEGQQPLPPEVVELLASSRSHHSRTAGTFDVTVAPLVRLWRDAGHEGRVPTPDELGAARARVGSERIALGADGATAALATAGMAVDFGGIAKGYALDRAAGQLRALGVGSALLDFGRSSVVAIGSPRDAPAWRLLLEHPARGALGVIALRDRSLSVSGSLAQGSEVAGRRYGHVIDPRSGRPLERDLVAAVIAPDAELAEVLSKALLVLGEESGIALVESVPSAEGFLADADGRTWTTRGWGVATSFAPAASAAGGT